MTRCVVGVACTSVAIVIGQLVGVPYTLLLYHAALDRK